MLSPLIVQTRGIEGIEIRDHGRWLLGMVLVKAFLLVIGPLGFS